jgi:hypothetical protein
MSSKFIKMINKDYYIEDYDEYINIDKYDSYKGLKNSIEDYLKDNKIKVSSIYKNYGGFGFDFTDLVFIILVLNGYKFKNNLFIAEMVCKILYRLKEEKIRESLLCYNDYKYEYNEKKKLRDYLLDLIKNNDKVKSYFENELIITDQEVEIIGVEEFYYGSTLFSFLNSYYKLLKLNLLISIPKITFNFNKHEKIYNQQNNNAKTRNNIL